MIGAIVVQSLRCFHGNSMQNFDEDTPFEKRKCGKEQRHCCRIEQCCKYNKV